MPGQPEKKKILITVRTYPTPAKKGVEVSCTGGVTENGEWIRLFPLPYRFLKYEQRFKKYQWIEARVWKASDSRQESHNIDCDSIKIISPMLTTKNDWQERKDRVYPLKRHCLCCIQNERDQNGFPTLGIFKPKVIERLVIKPDRSPWTQDQVNILRQGSLLDEAPTEELEKIPYDFQYRFRCDHAECSGHTMGCTDWEIAQLWRNCRDKYGHHWEEKFREKAEEEMINKRDTHFYVGNMHAYQKTWIIVGLFSPPQPKAGTNYSLFT